MAYQPRNRINTTGRLILLSLLLTLTALGISFWLTETSWQLSIVIICCGLLLALLQQLALKPLRQEIEALNLHAQNLQDGSFNTSANQLHINELAPLALSLNKMSEQIQHERQNLYQRELLLDTVLQSSPTALLLTNDTGSVLMSNPAARQLLSQGKPFDGKKLLQILNQQPELTAAVKAQQQGLIHLQSAEAAIWHLAISHFQLNQKQHWLYLLKPLTRELQREELTAWKKLLRVIGHELNNTLAPLSSLAFSGSELALRQQQPRLQQLFDTISERCLHLNQFVQAYIQFAKLPAPEITDINWPRLINQLQDQYEFELEGYLPKNPWQADPRLLSQLLLNLLKNAHESGSAPELIKLSFTENQQQLSIILQDAGGGMTEDAMAHALIPFYTSKNGGSGIGLTLCRDIAEAHGGSLTLHNIPDGLEVKVVLPVQQHGSRSAPHL